MNEHTNEKYDVERLCQISPQELEAANLIRKSDHGSRNENEGYCCVYCSSGTGKNRSGALGFNFKGDHWVHYCHACGNGGNNITLFKSVFNADFPDACRHASEMFGIPIQENYSYKYDTDNKPRPPIESRSMPEREEIKIERRCKLPDYTLEDPKELELIINDIKQSKEYFKWLPVDKKPHSIFRGLEMWTLEHFNCGYLPGWIHPKNRRRNEHLYPSRRFIIPTPDGEHYNAVMLPEDRGKKENERPKMHAGKIRLFNPNGLQSETIFSVEGEIDAMSIWQAMNYGWQKSPESKLTNPVEMVVATCSAAGWKNTVIPLIDAGYITWRKFIILLDKDDTGIDQSSKFQAALAERNFPAVIRFMSDFVTPPPEFVNTNDWVEKIALESLSKWREKNPDAKVDANQILQDCGSYTLRSIMRWILRSAEKEFGDIHHQVDLNFDAADSDVTSKSQPAAKPTGINLAAAGYDDVQAAEPTADIDSDTETQNEDDATDNSCNNAIFEWQKFKGTIDPVAMADLLAAKKFLDTLNADNITAEIAQSSKLKHALAMCKFYDAFVAAHDKFFTALAKAKSDAKTKIKLAESDYDGLTAPENIDAARALYNVSVRDLKIAVANFGKEIAKAHKNFQRAEKARLADEHNKKIRAGIEAKIADSIARLDFLRTQPQSPARDAEMIQLIRDACEWRYNNRQEPVAVKDTAANADLIFTYDPVIDGLFAFDEFYGMDVFLKAPPWQSAACINSEFKDRDDQHLRQYIRRTYTELVNKELIYDTTTVYSDKRKFNPVKKMFKTLPKWDGIRRAYSLFIDFLRADNNDYVREVTKNMLIAAIARIMFPGCEFQTAVVLQGEQGIGKSHIFKRLGRKWCATLSDSVDSPNAIDAIQLIWIVEIKEMAAMRKAELNATKSFIERSVDVRRAAYGRRAGRIPRHCIFVITVNDEKFLTDLTGNRRYNIIKCHSKPRDYITGLTDEYIDQVWAEVYHDFCELFKDQFDPETQTFTTPIDESRLELPVAARITADEVAQNYVRDDGLPTEIQSWLDTKIPPQFIWRLLTKSERAEFCRDKRLTLADALEILPLRRSLNFSPRNLERDIEQIKNFLNNRACCRLTTIKNKIGDIRDAIEIYGTEYRQHICISEIFNECFGSNSKRNPSRINDMFSRIQGWSLGKGVSSDPEYGRQWRGQVMWRNADNIPNFDDDAPDFTEEENESPSPAQNVFDGVPVAKEDLPFDPDDLPL